MDDSLLDSMTIESEPSLFLFLVDFLSFFFFEAVEVFSLFLALDFNPSLKEISQFFEGRIGIIETLFNHIVLPHLWTWNGK